jgi:hypothetical protein
MELSRKRRRQLKRLRGNASDLWEEQREVLDRATKVLGEARRQLAGVSREEIAPRVRDAVENRMLPTVATGIVATKHAARSAKDRITEQVLPAVNSAFGSALALAEVAKEMKVREAVERVRRSSAPQKSSGPGRFILMAVGVVAAAGMAYAAWQTLRSDDDLWVGDEADGFEEPLPS